MKAKLTGWFLVVLMIGCKTTDPVPTYEEQLAEDIAIIDAYLAANGIVAQTHESGLRYVITEPTDGPKPTKDNCATVNYVGNFLVEADEPFDSGTVKTWVKNSGLILGWQIGLKFFPVGSKGVMYLPSGLGYGAVGAQEIPANSILKFNIEMVAIHEYNATGAYCKQ